MSTDSPPGDPLLAASPLSNAGCLGTESPGDAGVLRPGTTTLALAGLEQELSRLQRLIRQTITAKLNQFSGQSMGTIDENRQWVESIATLLDSHGLRVQCSECGHPAILRVSPRGNSSGVFVFDHTIDRRRTFHGGKSRMPEIRLVAKPPRQKTRKKLAS